MSAWRLRTMAIFQSRVHADSRRPSFRGEGSMVTARCRGLMAEGGDWDVVAADFKDPAARLGA